MRILIVSYYFPPMNSVASLRVFSWARVWADAGHRITVLTAPKPLNDDLLSMHTEQIEIIEASGFLLKIFQRLLSAKYSKNKSDPNNFKHTRILKKLFQQVNAWRKQRGIMYTLRMPDYLSLWKRSALEQIKDRKFDIVVSSFGPYVTHLIAEKIIDNKQARRWIADYRDLWIDHGLMKGLFPFTILEKKLQYRINNKANLITTVSKPLSKILRKRCIAENKVHVIYNGYLEQTYSKLKKDGSRLWNDKKIRLVYTGSIYEKAQNYIPLLESLKKIKSCQPNLFTRLEVIVASRNAGKMVETVTRYNINECFVFTGAISHQLALQMQKETDVLLFFDYDTQIMPGVITGKLFEYMNSGSEIWSIGFEEIKTDANTFLVESNTGRIFGNDILAIYEQLCKLLTVKTKPVMNTNVAFIKQFSRESQAKKMLELVLG